MSTLQVENLIGPTSGSNANKVIIPSGQTLDASNGFVAPTGHVIQVQHGTLAGSGSLVTGQVNYLNTGLSVSITPRFDNSKFIVMASQIIGIGAVSTNTPARYDLRIREVNISSGTDIWVGRYVGTDSQESGNLSVVSGIHGYYTASSTNALTFNTQVREAGGTDGSASSMYFNWYAGGLATITAMEIAQ